VVGVLVACSACGLIWQNQVNAGLIAFVLADLILIPAFVLLLRTRRKTKQIARQVEDAQQEQLDALGDVGKLSKQEGHDESAQTHARIGENEDDR
jgi:hypothetical protein